jgi:hypothetical protein
VTGSPVRANGSRAAVVIGGCAVVLAAVSVARAFTGGGATALVVPLLLALAEAGAALALVRRVPYAKPAAGAMLFLTGLLHLLVALGRAEWWVRSISAVVLVASIYAVILLLRKEST